ncbi:Na+-transporting NADH:ubiquinone oxidoreductase subunit A [Salinimicrobium catena]|uniref:Na(+)-translocating NADH-quinone reductase subunit A n=1 Tax=Salinimicrobium catena TaxID=390640 RepID=A0A1H5PCU9_9FLAO|nr:Na(+)-translocating NADH-quinone reductase subunit A [Salinimicrobium catena]SDL78884.1 Na+-transporting NADH:ubiquinone oxidoreductase subunit A [Salinimicrobium catena]SEF11540.1 Na+-transporting NADH:ubiquinone oxidoreductase subunit A [Salinimicrobium catena]
MSNDIRIKRGLTLRLKGEAEKTLVDAPRSKTFAIKPPDFHSVVPKMVVKEGATVQAGDELFFSKYTPEVRFTSPVSGTLKEIKRGEKRRIMEVIIEADSADSYREFGVIDPVSADAEAVKNRILESGCWAFINQRPYDIIADPKDTPKAIFISAMNTAPLSADVEFILKDRMNAFQTGLNALAKLTPGKVHVSVQKGSSLFSGLKNVELHNVSGPHPAANVGVQIHNIDPINIGERVWTVNPEDVANMGDLFLTGKFTATRTIAVAGTEAKDRKYFRTKIGANVGSLVGKIDEDNVRTISGDVLTGQKVSDTGHLGFLPNELTLIPEGNKYRMFGWLPFTYNNIPSNSRTSLTWLFPKKKYEVNTNLHGEERALVVTGEMEEVMPMDIYPMQLLKACMAADIEKMENLGIYEVAPEDFALIDYVNTSKIEAQEIIRLGLDLMITEVG